MGYYVIMRKYYGFPSYMNTDLSSEEDCFSFVSEEEANECIRSIFNNGEWMDDLRYGTIRHYVEKKEA